MAQNFRRTLSTGLIATTLSTAFFGMPAFAESYILDNRTGVSLDVFRKGADGTETYSKTIFSDKLSKIEAEPNDILTFKLGTSQSHEGVDQIRIVEGKDIYELRMARKTVDTLPASYKSVANFDPNLHSYDIFYIDPFHIDNADAKKGLIFERLGLKDRDYVIQDGNIYHKAGFNYLAVDSGWGSKETKYHASTRSFLDEFSFSIKLGASKGQKDEKAKGSLSGSYSKMTKDVTKDKRAWTTSRQDIVKYHVTTVGNGQRLSRGFIDAVLALPETGGRSAYDTFVKNWGTHYPTQIEYGGIYMGIRSMTESQVIKTIEEGWDIKAEAQVPVKGVSTSGTGSYGQKEIKTNSQLDRHSKSKYQYRGGTGGLGGWTVNEGAQPVSIQLKRLHELLDTRRFEASVVSEAALKKKRSNLEAAITRYIGTAVDVNGSSIKPRVFKLQMVDMYPNDLDDSTDAVFGNVKVAPLGGLEKDKEPGSHGNTFWSRSEAGGSRVILKVGQSYSTRYPGAFSAMQQTFVVHPGPNGDYDLSKKGVRLSSKLMDYDKSSANDTIGSTSKTVYLKDFKPGAQKQLVVNDGGEDDTNENGKITITFKVEEVNQAFSRLYED